MRKWVHIAVTILCMLAASRFLVRLIDATVQIDDDIGMLVLALLLLNAAIGFASHKLYRTFKKQTARTKRKEMVQSKNMSRTKGGR